MRESQKLILIIKNENDELELYSTKRIYKEVAPDWKDDAKFLYDKLAGVNSFNDFEEMLNSYKKTNKIKENFLVQLEKANNVNLEQLLKKAIDTGDEYDNQKQFDRKYPFWEKMFCNNGFTKNSNYGGFFINDDKTLSILSSNRDADFCNVYLPYTNTLFIKNITGEKISIKLEDGNYTLPNNQILISYFDEYYNDKCNFEIEKLQKENNKIKFILVDPFNHDINKSNGEVIEMEPELENYYKLLDCETIDITQRYIGGKPYDIIVDDEGLLKENKISCINPASYLISDNYRQNDLLAGKVLITKYNEESGKNISLNDEDIKNIQNRIQNNVLIMYFQENEEKEIIDEGTKYGLDGEVINNFFSNKAKTMYVSSNNFSSNYEISEDDFINE